MTRRLVLTVAVPAAAAGVFLALWLALDHATDLR